MTLGYIINKIFKKLCVYATIIVALCILLQGCDDNKSNSSYKTVKAIIVIGDEKIEVDVDEWQYYDTDSTIKIKGNDGNTYITDFKNILFINEK